MSHAPRTRRRARRLTSSLALGTALAMSAAACSGGGDTIEVSAVFDDVRDLVPRNSVRAGDVIVGTVRSIELTDGYEALVTMAIDEEANLPANVRAEVNRTSILGEKFIDIQPISAGGALSDGDVIENTDVVEDLENLIASGGELVAAVSANQLAATVQLGAQAFGGRGSILGNLLTDVNTFVGELNADAPALLSAIDKLDAATARLAPRAETNAATLKELREASEALQLEDDRLVDTLDDLQRLGVVGQRILIEQGAQIDETVRQLRKVTDQLTRVDGALQNLLTWAPRHNTFVPAGGISLNADGSNAMAQVWLDFIVCGLNDTDGDPSRDCTPPNVGESNAPNPAFVDQDCIETAGRTGSFEDCEAREAKIAEGN